MVTQAVNCRIVREALLPLPPKSFHQIGICPSCCSACRAEESEHLLGYPGGVNVGVYMPTCKASVADKLPSGMSPTAHLTTLEKRLRSELVGRIDMPIALLIALTIALRTAHRYPIGQYAQKYLSGLYNETSVWMLKHRIYRNQYMSSLVNSE